MKRKRLGKFPSRFSYFIVLSQNRMRIAAVSALEAYPPGWRPPQSVPLIRPFALAQAMASRA